MTAPSEDITLEDFVRELAEHRGLDFRGYKRSSLQRRISRRMSHLNIHTFREYAKYVEQNERESSDLLQSVLINVTRFMRDPMAWEALQREAFPLLLRHRFKGGTFRAWCAGCATGEEAYTLAILLSEYLRSDIDDVKVRIYATDHDEDAINFARRGEYGAESTRDIRPDLREKYFHSTGGTLRITREIRKLVIFGRSNLVADAPISHVNVLICRNVLIYFDLALQKRILQRFRYALDPGGILFLGKAETQLRENSDFRPIDSKWRIFQYAPHAAATHRASGRDESLDKTHEEYDNLRTLQRNILETLRSAIIVLDSADVITLVNPSALHTWGISGESLEGKQLGATPLIERSRELSDWLRRSHSAGTEQLEFRTRIEINSEPRTLVVTIRPTLDDTGRRTGTLLYAEDISHQDQLRTTLEQLETTAEELHSANEELETTNEELQSTNEELETTNEELQSTNEELETTNEELQSLNEELETANDELEMRTRELDEINRRYSETLEHMPNAIVVVNDENKVVVWNAAAQKLFGLHPKGVVGLGLSELPLPMSFRNRLVTRVGSVRANGRAANIEMADVKVGSFTGTLSIRLTPVNSPTLRAVLILVTPDRQTRSSAKKTATTAAKDGKK